MSPYGRAWVCLTTWFFLRPTFNTPLKVAHTDMYTKTDAKLADFFFLENDQRPEFLLIWGSKVAQKWAPEAHILHTSKSTCNEHVKQYWCETIENFLRIWPKTGILTCLGPQNRPKIGPLRPIFRTPLKSTCNVHVKQYWCETSENFLIKWPWTRILSYFVVQNGTKLGL